MSSGDNNTRVGEPVFDPARIRDPEVLSDLIHKVGHEIGNPLTAIISLAAIIERFHDESVSPPSPGAKKTGSYAASISEEAWKISALSERLVMLLSQKPGNISPCDLLEALEKAAHRIRLRHKNKRLDVVSTQLGDEIPLVAVDSEQLNVLLTELLINAQNALVYEWPEGNPSRSISAFIKSDGSNCILIVSNDAPHPREVELSTLFDPFVTTHSERKHIGLGLTVCWAIVKRFNGSLRVIEHIRPTGCSFTVEVTFPGAAAE